MRTGGSLERRAAPRKGYTWIPEIAESASNHTMVADAVDVIPNLLDQNHAGDVILNNRARGDASDLAKKFKPKSRKSPKGGIDHRPFFGWLINSFGINARTNSGCSSVARVSLKPFVYDSTIWTCSIAILYRTIRCCDRTL